MPISITPDEQRLLKDVIIPPQPKVLLDVVAEIKKDEPEFSVIANAISSDIGISAAILQIVNSAAYRRAVAIDSIEQAVMVLGLRRILPVVKSVALRSSMQESQKLNSFWDRASDIASMSALVADYLGKAALVDQAYMMGLFHEAGIPLMYQCYDDYPNLLREREMNGWIGLIDAEHDRYETTHATLGALLGQKWKLCDSMVDAIYFLHDVDGLFASGELDETAIDLVAIIKIARHIVTTGQAGISHDTEWEVIKEDILDHLHMDSSEVDDMCVKVAQKHRGA